MPAPVFFLESEQRLIGRIAEGDRDALVSVYRANWKVILSFVLRNSGTEDDADDLLQEALVVLWERIRSGRFEQKARLGTFLYATARNLWMRRLARSRRETVIDDLPEQAAPADMSPLELLIDDENSAAVGRALGMIGEPCKSLLLLFYWEERTMEEIAAVLGFANADTAKAKKYQCKKALERALIELMA